MVSRGMEKLRHLSAEWGVPLGRPQISLLAAYADILATYQLANVIGVRDRETIVLEHVTDSLSCLALEDLAGDKSIVDVGTGGGLPGIPLAIVCSNLRVTLLEAREKKVRFLQHAAATLGLTNLQVLHARAEDAGRTAPYRDAFDLATARALAPLPVVVEYCAPLVGIGGGILAMKGRLAEKELSQGRTASTRVGARLREVREVNYHGLLPQKQRQLVIFEKIRATPERFPRKAGLAKKRPLGN